MANKYLLGIAGVIAVVVGIVGAIPSFLQGSLVFGVVSTLVMVAGLVLLALAFGD